MGTSEKTRPPEQENGVLVAGVIYLLMKKTYHISRNVRVHWFLQHLNTKISVPNRIVLTDIDSELTVLSVVPQEPPPEWKPECGYLYQYLVTSSSNVVFLSEIYRTVYCLDMSPSISAVDIQHGQIMIDEMLETLNRSLRGVVKPFFVPGSCIKFEPQIFVTVIVHTPFFTTPAQQVLVQGWQVTPDNLDEFLSAIQKQLQLLEDTIAEVSALAYDQLEAVRIRQMESEKLVGALFEENSEKQFPSEITMVSPDSGFINLLRYGMLALRLLPPSSTSNLIVVTDGIIALPDIHVLDSVLTQLHTNAVAVSFLHVGSQFHPHCSQGQVPYSELMQFIACATLGAYIPSAAVVATEDEFNVYHEALLTWSFKKESSVQELITPMPHSGEWNISNQSFYGNREPQLLHKKQVEDILNASLTSILCCRLREGFMIKNIYLKDNQLEINLVLPWANHIYIEYLVSCQWPNSSTSGVRYAISIRAPYEFLHDITCLMKKQFQSPYRQAVVSRFWSTLKTLGQSDLLLAHLDSFSSYPNSYLVPESIRSGMPLFYLPSNNGPPVLCSSDPSCPQFAQFWRPVCLIDPSVWHKWLHTYRFCLILQHDLPLPRYLHTASPNGRYQGVQSRHASATLFNFLKDWTSFVLIENHTYLKLVSSGENDKTPSWFYIIRVISKPTLAVIHIAFLGGTPGKLRYQIAEKLKERISALMIPQRLATKDTLTRSVLEGRQVESQIRSEVPCCILLQKPLEKILIRYERMPSEFGTVVFPDGTQPHTAAKPLRPTSSLVTTLSRYLHHRRWVWTASAHSSSLGHSAVARILATLTNMRLQEGFKFAHSSAGIVNMVLEVQMKCCDEDMDHTCKNCRPSIIQYVLFPLRVTTPAGKNSSSDDEGTDEAEGDTDSESTLELIAECWIEPQHGVVAKGPDSRAYMENLPYHQLADVMWRMDAECISALLTFEHLCLMCQNPQVLPPVTVNLLDAQPQNPLENWPDAVALSDKRIHCIPFAYNLMTILPKCQQVELQFSMFIQEIIEQWEMKSPGDAPNVLLMETLFNQLRESHDKELFLNAQESKQFVELIVNRERDVESHPIPFPRRYSQDIEAKTNQPKISDPEIQTTTEKNNALIDLSKILSSLVDENVFGSIQSPGHSKNIEGKETPDKGLRKSCGPLYRMYPKVPPRMNKKRDSDAEPGTPRWRCFLKGMTPTHCILTFIPASYRDLKALMLGAETKTFTQITQSELPHYDDMFKESSISKEQKESDKRLAFESTLNPEAKPFLPSQSAMENASTSELFQNEMSSCSSSAPSKGWILEDIDSMSSSPFESETNDNELWDMSEPKLETGPPFRVRASSWNTFKTQPICPPDNALLNRLRARSIGSKGKEWSENKFKKKTMTYNIETISMQSLPYPQSTSKTVLGSLNIPIYVYDCPLSNLGEALVLKHEFVKQYTDQYYQRTFQTDCENTFAPADTDMINQYEWPEYKSDDSDSTPDDQDVRQHCRLISEAFNKSFVVSLFKSLHLGQNINTLNVQTAVDECEKAMVEINITKYLQTVCSHLKEINKQYLDLTERAKLFTSENENKIPLSLFRMPGPCQEYKHLHRLIKNKFLRILTVCFKAVPSNQDFYFCSPNWERDRLADVNHDVIEDGPRTIDHCQDFDSLTFQPDEFRSDHGSVLGANPWEVLGSATTPDDARTSLLSNMDSDSVSDFPEDEVSEDISPLFLHLICSIQSMGKTGKCSVRMLPTCFGEMLEDIDYPDTHIDLQDLDISLDILCLTLTSQCDKFSLPVHHQPLEVTGAGGLNIIPHSTVNVSVSPSTNTSTKHETLQGFTSTEEHFPQGIGFTPMDKLQHLPDYQHKAISTCVEEIKWLMDDEIAAFLLDSSPITEATLQLVANHVATSAGRSSCIMEVVPLQFVFSPEQSLAKFLEEFAVMQLQGYSLKKENDFYYVAKDTSASSSLQEPRINDTAPSFASEHSDAWLTSNLCGEEQRPDFASAIHGFNPSESSRFFNVEQKQIATGWSSVSAWHKEVANLMLSGRISEDLKNRLCRSEETSAWLKELELKRPLLPNFWLIMKVSQEAVTTYFHCRFLELETCEVKMYSLVQRNVVLNIKFVCKTVNQTMLLNNLHDTRMCNLLLEPEGSDDIWKTNQTSKNAEDGGEIEHTGSSLESDYKFTSGCFSCNVVWETHFVLHPRLKTGPGKQGLSRGIQALRTVLNRFSVNNRKNMFVYQDHSGNVFYLRLHENFRVQSRLQDMDDNTPSSVSRSSSINSLNNTNIRKSEDQLLFALKEVRPRVKSFGEMADGLSSLRQEEFLTLKVHGISEAGPEVKNELVQVLQNRLDDAVLEVVSVMLARNPMCKLSPDDVHFIQKPNHPPESIIQFTVQPHALCRLQALSYYLRQNLLQFLYTPKYTDSRSQYHFQDYSQPEDSGKHIPERNLFLYNQSPASGSKGIACIAVALVDCKSTLIHRYDQPRSKVTAYKDNPISSSQFNELTTTSVYEHNPANVNPEHDALIEFRIWKQGRVNIESLSVKLKAAIRHSLWDLLLELNLLSAPLSENSPLNYVDDYDENLSQGPLHEVYQNIMDPWMQFGSSIGVPAVRTNIVTLAQRHSVMVTLKEVHALASINDTKGFVYYHSISGKKQFLPYDFNMKLPSYTKCMIIARNVGQWKACLSDEPSLYSEKVDPKAQKVLQKFPPLLEASFGDTVSFAPRQRFLIALLSNEQIIIHTYNWAKDLMESLTKQMTNLGMWLSARSNLLTGIISQKLGVFHNQPCVRKSTSQINDVETLVSFPGASRSVRTGSPNVVQMLEVLRDTKSVPAKKSLSTDHVVIFTQQLLDTRNHYKRDHQNKLYTMWQTRGATPNIPQSEEILELFIQHSRFMHYCLTPLLFLPRWRILSSATRDHTLKSNRKETKGPIMDLHRNTGIPEEKWHHALCITFINEYKQYLQTLGFIPIQTGPSTPRKGGGGGGGGRTCNRRGKNHCYLQKSLLGGILLFELYLSEPFFHAKLHAIECFRLEGKSPSALISQFTLSFLDECDKIKMLMHLHSFTYDFHLRCLHTFISGKEQLFVPGYHITSFLDDFLKYYSKAPNYARNLAHSGYLNISKITTPAQQLFTYLLSHENIYDLEVLHMVPVHINVIEKLNPEETECVLVKLSSTPHVTYKDLHDVKQTDDFDVTLIVAHQDNVDQSTLSLRYFIVLTSRRESYPKIDIEKKLGQFRTVPIPNPSGLMYPVSRPVNPPLTIVESIESFKETMKGSPLDETNDSPDKGIIITRIEIRPESIHYLGYYSSHEQVMQQLILEYAQTAHQQIEAIIKQGSLHCRTHHLWNKLLSAVPASQQLTYMEFSELYNLAEVQMVTDADSRLTPMLYQSISWYQSLIKLLISKYWDHYRLFVSPDANTQHLLILHPKFLEGFVMLTVDAQSGRGEMSIVSRKPVNPQTEISKKDLQSLVEDTVNACCFHLWVGLL